MSRTATQPRPVKLTNSARATVARSESFAGTPAQPIVTTVRSALLELVQAGTPSALNIAFELVAGHYRSISSACPVTEDLRPWQLLAIDFAAALTPIDVARAEQANQLADEIRAMVTMLARNPVESLALRPASRRVLEVLATAGGRAELVQVREQSGHTPTHFSNILKPLVAHGLVRPMQSTIDKRAKMLVLTDAGRAALPQIEPKARSTAHYSLNLAIEPAEVDSAYPPVRTSEFDIA